MVAISPEGGPGGSETLSEAEQLRKRDRVIREQIAEIRAVWNETRNELRDDAERIQYALEDVELELAASELPKGDLDADIIAAASGVLDRANNFLDEYNLSAHPWAHPSGTREKPPSRDHDITSADAYKVLGVSSGASENEILLAFRELSKVYHPDRPGGDHAKFVKLVEARDNILGSDRDTWNNASGPDMAQETGTTQALDERAEPPVSMVEQKIDRKRELELKMQELKARGMKVMQSGDMENFTQIRKQYRALQKEYANL